MGRKPVEVFTEVFVARSAPLMRGLKLDFDVVLAVADMPGRAIRPAYEGIETVSCNRSTDLYNPGRAIRPAYEGIETSPLSSLPPRRPKSQVARSAPLMRGLKPSIGLYGDSTENLCRAIRPAYEGIETTQSIRPGFDCRDQVARSAPLMRGLKRLSVEHTPVFLYVFVARSAPLMRGLKRNWPRMHSPWTTSGRAIRPAYEGIETGRTRLLGLDGGFVARSAPLMRGLKHLMGSPLCGITSIPVSRDPPRL